MRDKKKCWECKYHSYFGTLGKTKKTFSSLSPAEREKIMCFYSVHENCSCLHKENGEIVDSRGPKDEPCRLFAKGEPDNLKRDIYLTQGN